MAAPTIGYEVRYRRADSSAPWTVRQFGPDTTTLTIPGMTRGEQYDCEARSMGPNGLCSAWVPVTVVVAGPSTSPAAPYSLGARAAPDGVTLKWSIPEGQRPDVDYVVQRSASSGGVYVDVARVRGDSWLDVTSNASTYWYRVKAVNFLGMESGLSNLVSGTGVSISALQTQINNAMQTAQNAQASADGSIDIFFGPVQPVGKLGDYWQDATKKWWRFSGSIWVDASDERIPAAILAANNAAGSANAARAIADSKIRFFESETAPVGADVGDNWFQRSTGLTRYWSGSGWSLIADNSLQTQAAATLVVNGGFEAGTESWVLEPSYYLQAGNGANYVGAYGLVRSFNATQTSAYCTAYIAVAEGDTMVAECFISNAVGSANGDPRLMVWYYNGVGQNIGATSATYASGQVATGTWRKVVLALKVPGGTATVRIGCTVLSHTAGYWCFDQFRMVRVPETDTPSANLLANANFGGLNGALHPWGISWNPAQAPMELGNKRTGVQGGAFWTLDGNVGVLGMTTGAKSAGSPSICDLANGFKIPVMPGQRYQAHCLIAAHRCTVQVLVVWCDASGNNLGIENGSAYLHAIGGRAESGHVQNGLFVYAPAGAAQAWFILRRTDTNPGEPNSYSWFSKAYFGTAKRDQVTFSPWTDSPPANADSIGAGVDFTVVSSYDVYDYPGMRRLGLRVPNSGHRIGNQANLPQSNTTNYGSIRNVASLSATSAGVVSVNAHTVSYGGISVAYAAVPSAVVGLARGARYSIYCFDDAYQGGVRTWYAGTSPSQVMGLGDGVVVAGEITIPTTGSGGGGGGGGGGPGDWCVDYLTAILPTGQYVRELRVGNLVPCWNMDADAPAVEWHPVQSIVFGVEESFDLFAEDGTFIRQSASTPMVCRDGITRRTDEMKGQEVLTNRCGALAWSPVAELLPVGVRRVVKMNCGDRVFFAGGDPTATLATHNAIYKP